MLDNDRVHGGSVARRRPFDKLMVTHFYILSWSDRLGERAHGC